MLKISINTAIKLVSVHKVTSLNFNSPVLQGWDLNMPNFQQGIHALIIWNITCLKRRERRQNVFSICNPAMKRLCENALSRGLELGGKKMTISD